MKAWKLETKIYPENERQGVWCDAMQKLCLPVSKISQQEGFSGTLSYLVSPLGIEFALAEAGPQVISGRYPDQEEAVWLAMLLQGEAELIEGERHIDLVPGDIVFGPTGAEATLRLATDFRQLFVKAPRIVLDPRLLTPMHLKIGVLRADSGINSVFSGMLRALSEVLDQITPEQLRPVELSLTEFLIASLAGESDIFRLGGAASAKAAHLHRICQTIETQLGSPDLTPRRIAEEHGVSLRYLQNLFTLAGNRFTNYVRTRRLERCRADLVSPLYAGQSISEICYRWGFNDSAHFSRTFRNQYNMSPRDYRRAGSRTDDPQQ